MSFRSVNGIYVPDYLSPAERFSEKYSSSEHEGTFFYGELQFRDQAGAWNCTSLWALMPYWREKEFDWWTWHCLAICAPGDQTPTKRHYWQWDGNVEKPTLSPSIGCGVRPNFDWHGYLRAGRFEACK